LSGVNSEAVWVQEASAAIGFVKATDTLRKKLHITFKKSSIPLKMYLKSLAVLGKASISLEISSKSLVMFIKSSY
jgi:hypothetical protein